MARQGLKGRLALAIGVALLAGSAFGQGEAEWIEDLESRIRALVDDPGARDPEVAYELESLEAELEGLSLEARGEALRSAHLALYVARSERALHELDLEADERLTLHRSALASARKSANHEAVARAGLGIAEHLRITGRLREALELVQEVLAETPDAIGTRPFGLLWQADLERQVGLFDDALAHLDQAEAERPDGTAWRALSWRIPGVRGRIWLELGVLDLAAAAFARERAAYGDSERATADWIAIQLHATELALARGHVGEVERLVSETHAILASSGISNAATWRSELDLLAGFALARAPGATEDQLDVATRLIAGAIDGGELPARVNVTAEIRLAHLHIKRRRLDRARDRLQSARRTLEAWRKDASGLGPLLEEAELATTEARLALASGATRDELEACFQSLARATETRLQLWERTPLRPAGLGFLEHRSRRAWTSELVRLALRIDPERGAERALEHIEAAHRAGTLDRRLARRPHATSVAPGSWRDSLPTNGGWIIYLPGPYQSHAIGVDSSGAIGVELADEAALAELGRRFSRALAHEEPLDGSVAQTLSRALLPEGIRDRLDRWQALTVVGAELFPSIPFALLDGGRGPLSLTHALAHAPSLSLIARLSERASKRTEATRDLVLFAAPTTAPSVLEAFPEARSLRFSPERARQWTEPFRATASHVRLGDAANRSELAAAPLPDSRVFAFFGHGVHDPARERPATLVLARDVDGESLLDCEDVEQLDPPPFALLMACGAGAGRRRAGDEIVSHQGGAWLYAGAESVLVADTSLRTGLAHDLARVLLAEIARGVSPAEALQDARLAWVKAEGLASLKQTRSLMIHGLGHRPVFQPSEKPSWLPLVLGGFALLLVFSGTHITRVLSQSVSKHGSESASHKAD